MATMGAVDDEAFEEKRTPTWALMAHKDFDMLMNGDSL